VQVGEVDLDPGIGGEGLVQGHLLAAIIGDTESLLRFDAILHMRKSIDCGLGSGAVHLGQQGEQRGALDQRADGRAIVLSLEGVALSVSGDEPLFDLSGRSEMGTMLVICRGGHGHAHAGGVCSDRDATVQSPCCATRRAAWCR